MMAKRSKKKIRKRVKVKRQKKPIKQSNKLSLNTFFTYLFLFIGFSVLCYPIIYNKIYENRQASSVEMYDNKLKNSNKKELDTQIRNARAYNERLFKANNGTNEKTNRDYFNQLNFGDLSIPMGTVDIPSIRVKQMPFYHGTTDTVLQKGLGHLEYTSLPVGGENTHAFITGHSGLQNQVLFSHLNRIEKGDYFFVNTFGLTLKYKVFSKEAVDPSEVEKTLIVPGKDIVTLQTCTPADLNSHRLLISGERVPYEKEEDPGPNTIPKKKYLSYEQKVLIGLLVVVLFMIISTITRKKGKTNYVKNQKTRKKTK